MLDDNKLLTLPNGERLSLPPNVRIMFEVETLRYATLATVSRCGMVWFSDDTVTPSMLYRNYLKSLENTSLHAREDSVWQHLAIDGNDVSSSMIIQRQAASVLTPYFEPDALVDAALNDELANGSTSWTLRKAGLSVLSCRF